MKKKTNEEFVTELAAELVRTKELANYNLSKINYVDAKTKVTIICNEHGDKLISPFHLLNGRRCNECKGNNLSVKLRADWEVVRSKATALYENRYSYDKFEYINNQTKGVITCSEHGDFLMDMAHHIGRGQSCPKCRILKVKYFVEDLYDIFIEKAKQLHGYRYTYEKVDYKTCKDTILVTCPTHGEFSVTPDNHINALSGCPTCSHKVSLAEIEIRDYIKSLGIDIVCNKPMLNGRHIDIYLPQHRLGIEYCGLYWHSNKFRPQNYHRDKYILAKNSSISLLQIFEDEWLFKKDIVKSILLSKLHLLPKFKGARELVFSEVSNVSAKAFYHLNHLQGGSMAIESSFGVLDGNVLIACISFSSSNVPKGSTELVRFASSGRVPGGFSRILTNSIPYLKSTGKSKIVSFSDNRWSEGNMYEGNGFEYSGVSEVRYWWVKGQSRFHRRLFQRKYLPDRLSKFDASLSEAENCIADGYLKLHDAGVTKWVLNI